LTPAGIISEAKANFVVADRLALRLGIDVALVGVQQLISVESKPRFKPGTACGRLDSRAAMRRAIAGVAVLALGVGVMAETSALGDSGAVQRARRDLAQADLRPPPLWPRDIPEKIGCCRANFLGATGERFNVLFSMKRGGSLQRLVEYGRTGKGALRRTIKQFHSVKSPVRWQRIHGRRTAFGKGDVIFFYGWHQQGFSYFVLSRYLGGVKPKHLRRMVASARPLG